MKNIYIIDCKRSATGKYGGQLASYSAIDIISHIIKALSISFKSHINSCDGRINKIFMIAVKRTAPNQSIFRCHNFLYNSTKSRWLKNLDKIDA